MKKMGGWRLGCTIIKLLPLIFPHYTFYLRPPEERPAGVAGDGPIVSASLLRGNAADGAHIGHGLAGLRGHHIVLNYSELFLKTEIIKVVTLCNW